MIAVVQVGKFQSPYGDSGNTTEVISDAMTLPYWKFQSPYGDLGNTTTATTGIRMDIMPFQSPYGDLGNTTKSIKEDRSPDIEVSVPLRGFG